MNTGLTPSEFTIRANICDRPVINSYYQFLSELERNENNKTNCKHNNNGPLTLCCDSGITFNPWMDFNELAGTSIC